MTNAMEKPSPSHHHNFMAATLWLFNIAMENDPFIDDVPTINGDFP